jgi:hypothetical protein
MSTRQDPLDLPTVPDRVFYELGVMLDKDDFRAEQTYHRGRLARALAFLHGSGTAAGLLVRVPDPDGGAPTSPASVAVEEVHVAPGIAVDAVGRLIEVPSEHCVRLQKWLDAQGDGAVTGAPVDAHAAFDRVRQAFHPTVPGGSSGSLVIDVLLRFAACDRGKTPAFATGPFDALDAVQPSRIRDAFELQLVPRIESPLPIPINPWPDLTGLDPAARAAQLRAAVFGAWDASLPQDPPADPMVPLWLDPKGEQRWLFLARLSIPATAPTGTVDLPARVTDQKVAVDNDLRPLVYTAGALARLGGL